MNAKCKEIKCGGCKIIKPVDEFVTIYGYANPRGKYCFNCFARRQQEHATLLMEGRDFCLYCGIKIYKAYDWTKDGNSKCTYLHQDHMDPLSLGGEDFEGNTVYCCVSCNQKKGNLPFTKWLQKLKPKFRQISRRIYIDKHDFPPGQIKSKSKRSVSFDLVKMS